MFVKIDGVTTEEDALFAVAMGADAVGFVFAPSTRQIQPGRARDIAKRLPADVITVGVFRNEAKERVVEIVNGSGLGCAQLHGDETAEEALFVRERVPRLMKAFAAGDPRLDKWSKYGADAVIVDSPTPGSGQVFDWTILDGTRRGLRLILAGGLNPSNVAKAIEQVRPWGVDVSTGVESSPGHKDPAKVRAFVEEAKAAFLRFGSAEAVPTGSAPYDWQDEL